MSDITYSKYQLAIFEEDKTTNNNIFIKAGPGTSKSFVLKELLKRTPFYKKSILLAFNKSIAEELKDKVPIGVDVKTIHSMSYSVLRSNTSNKYKLSEIKTFILAKKIIPNYYEKDKKNGKKLMNVYLFTISKIYDLYRMNICEKTEEALIELSDEYNVDYNPRIITDTLKVVDSIEKYNDRNYSTKEMLIDFTDMLWLPYILVSSDNFPKYDKVLIDELQDMTPLQREVVLKLINKSGKFIAVGDSRQMIYGFMGANLKSFEKLQTYPNTTILPLSVSYRCGKNIIDRANQIFPGLESFEGNPDGVIRNGNLNEIRVGDMVLCRNNLPLIFIFLELLGLSRKSYIMGRDFGKSLCDLANKVDSIEEFDIVLNKKSENLKNRGVDQPLYHKSYVDLKEKVDIILMLINKKDYTLPEVITLFESLFRENPSDDAVMLSTVHKAKGLESDRVFWLQPNLMPSQYAETELELYQESCIEYVCVTRAKSELIIIN